MDFLLYVMTRGLGSFIMALLGLAALSMVSVWLAAAFVIVFGATGVLAFINGFHQGWKNFLAPRHRRRRSSRYSPRHIGTRKYAKTSSIQTAKRHRQRRPKESMGAHTRS